MIHNLVEKWLWQSVKVYAAAGRRPPQMEMTNRLLKCLTAFVLTGRLHSTRGLEPLVRPCSLQNPPNQLTIIARQYLKLQGGSCSSCRVLPIINHWEYCAIEGLLFLCLELLVLFDCIECVDWHNRRSVFRVLFFRAWWHLGTDRLTEVWLFFGGTSLFGRAHVVVALVGLLRYVARSKADFCRWLICLLSLVVLHLHVGCDVTSSVFELLDNFCRSIFLINVLLLGWLLIFATSCQITNAAPTPSRLVLLNQRF